jgi:hypothetical protein
MSGMIYTHVYAPELLNRVERNDFLEQLVPVVALCYLASSSRWRDTGLTLPLGGLVNQRVHWCMSGCLTLKFSGSWKTVRTSSSADDLEAADSSDEPAVMFAPSGEMGMVSRGTCCWPFGTDATSAMVVDCTM